MQLNTSVNICFALVDPFYGAADTRDLAVAYWVGMHLLVDPAAGVPEHVANEVVGVVLTLDPEEELNEALTTIGDELQRRGLTECFTCTCFNGLHLADQCDKA